MVRTPSHLSKNGKKLFKKIQNEYQITDAGGLSILTSAIEAYDRVNECQQTLEADGLTFLDRFGQTKPHPLCNVQRDARSQFLTFLKALNLDLEPLRDTIGRPPGS
jgi:P27 family predicted phage terminase small subunit